MKRYISFEGKHLGDIRFCPKEFSSDIYKEIDSEAFKKLGHFEQHERVNKILLAAIQGAEKEVFLLPQVIAYITHVRKILTTYHLTSFEFWLNQYALLSEEEKMEVRGKIVGKGIPRSEYQNFFPLQKGEYFPGSHYSCAHRSPDLDTTTASFACFLSAFGARVGEGRHHWMVPGGPPQESIEIELFFKKALGESLFLVAGSNSTKLMISALDLISQHNIVRKKPSEAIYGIDPDRKKQAVILVDEQGCYLDDWRSTDVDPVRFVVSRFRAFLFEYQNAFMVGVTSLFSKKILTQNDWKSFLEQKALMRFCDTRSAKELS